MTENGQFFSLWEIIFDFCIQASNAHILVIIALVLKAYTENCSEPELTVKLEQLYQECQARENKVMTHDQVSTLIIF